MTLLVLFQPLLAGPGSGIAGPPAYTSLGTFGASSLVGSATATVASPSVGLASKATTGTVPPAQAVAARVDAITGVTATAGTAVTAATTAVTRTGPGASGATAATTNQAGSTTATTGTPPPPTSTTVDRKAP
jgi:hypothetical protein